MFSKGERLRAVSRRRSRWSCGRGMSLARLWRQQGKKKAARQMLTKSTAGSRGFDTRDLQEAQVLLDELS